MDHYPTRTTYAWQDVPSEEVPSDREMKSALVHRLNENLYTQDADIKVDVEHRVVVLGGEVDSPDAAGPRSTTRGTCPAWSTSATSSSWRGRTDDPFRRAA